MNSDLLGPDPQFKIVISPTSNLQSDHGASPPFSDIAVSTNVRGAAADSPLGGYGNCRLRAGPPEIRHVAALRRRDQDERLDRSGSRGFPRRGPARSVWMSLPRARGLVRPRSSSTHPGAGGGRRALVPDQPPAPNVGRRNPAVRGDWATLRPRGRRIHGTDVGNRALGSPVDGGFAEEIERLAALGVASITTNDCELGRGVRARDRGFRHGIDPPLARGLHRAILQAASAPPRSSPNRSIAVRP